MTADDQNFAPGPGLTYANVVATVAAARAAGLQWLEPAIDRKAHVVVGDRPLLHILERGGLRWRSASPLERHTALDEARHKLDLHVQTEMKLAELIEKIAAEQTRIDKATGQRGDMLISVAKWPKLRMRELTFGDVEEVLHANEGVAAAIAELRAVLPACPVPPQRRTKAKEWYIYDQRELQKIIRSVLTAKGWSRDQMLAPAEEEGNVKVTEASADLLRSGVHAILDFGNRAAYAYNFFTRASLASARAGVKLTALIVPTFRFADQIDSNLVCYERVAVEVRRVASIPSSPAPLPLALYGVEPDVE